MPWIPAAAAVVGVVSSQSQQAQGAAGQRSAANQGQQAKAQAQPFTPTAGASQQLMSSAAPPEAMDLASGGSRPSPMAQPPPPGGSGGGMSGGGGSNTLSNVNQAAQLGSTLQQIFQGQQAQGANTRAQALAGRPQASMQPFRPTALNQMDPRLQQLMGR